MGRPLKEGLDYFPMDTNLDDKIRAVESVFKNDGFVWIIKFWQAAYKTNTGEVCLEGYHGVIHADNSRVTPEKQSEILKLCLEIGLLYKTEAGNYTSNGIQKRIKHIITERERWRNKEENELSPKITPERRGEIKLKETKLKKEGVLSILEFWNKEAAPLNIPCIKEISESRRIKLEKRSVNKEKLVLIFNEIRQSRFLCGENSNNWKISFDWLLENDKNMLKVLEGNYRDKTTALARSKPMFALEQK